MGFPITDLIVIFARECAMLIGIRERLVSVELIIIFLCPAIVSISEKSHSLAAIMITKKI
ncbi:MAG: hypothetical protein ACQEQO_09765 [Thermodesulfobacteriota bacterium]